VFLKLVKPLELQEVPVITFLTANEGEMHTKSMAKFRINLGGHQSELDVYVVPEYQGDIILGLNWIKEQGAYLDFKNEVLRIKDNELPLIVGEICNSRVPIQLIWGERVEARS
jgi:hypothetical protein